SSPGQLTLLQCGFSK
nr:Chain B, DNA excision repair protein ERCC-6-like 2 [Homo sapiens]8COB_D Chain D, DNA excision repair protein ERCC-6-like 2 [Homo sapiens]8COB_F Chain F, DNA excision repair protein ERCC-6-like 2 [Homo sapiens]